MEYQLEQMIMI